MDEESKNSENKDSQKKPIEGIQETEQEITNLKRDLERARDEIKQNYDSYLRALAEGENIRKRALKDVENFKKLSFENFFKDFLPTLDSIDNALNTKNEGKESTHSIQEGFALVRKQLIEVLERNGLRAISAVGEKFDPTAHQAIQRVESPDVEEDCVKEEFAKGYRLHDKLLRPAIVSVFVPTSKK